VFYVDIGLNVHELYMSGYITPKGEWQHVSVTEQTGLQVASGGSLASQAFSTGATGVFEHLYIADANSNVWDIQSTPRQGTAVSWSGAQDVSYANLGNKFGPPSGSPLAVTYNLLCSYGCEPGVGTEQVFWIDGSPTVVASYSIPNPSMAGWRYFSQLTYGTGAPPPAP